MSWRVALWNAWKLFEEAHGNAEEVKKVEGMMPIVPKKHDDSEKESNPSRLKLLQMAHAWKQAAGGGGAGAFSNITAATQDESSSEDEESDEEEEEGRKRGANDDDDSMDICSGEETKKRKGPTPDSSKDGSVFPLEIFGVIISHLAWAAESYDGDSHKDLKNCSLVCRSFSDLCRPHIFSSLDITFKFDQGGFPVPSLDLFARLLAHKPILADYVKNLTCLFDSTNIEAKQVPGLTVLFKLPNIQRLVIPPAYAIARNCTLYYTPENYMLTHRKIFDHFMTSQKLATMEISNMWYPPLIRLFSSPALRNLELRRCLINQSDWESLPDICIPANGFNLTPWRYWRCKTSSHAMKTPPRSALLRSRPFSSFGRLRTLSLGGNFNWLNFCKWLDVAGVVFFRELQDLRICMDRDENVPGIWELLKHVRILDRLHLKISSPYLRLTECIRSSKSTLKDLSLDYESSLIKNTSKFVNEISSILARMGPYSVLEDFSIQIALFDIDIMVLKARLIDPLKQLRNALLCDTNETFAQLRSVTFTVQTYSHANIDFEILQKVVDEPFKEFWAQLKHVCTPPSRTLSMIEKGFPMDAYQDALTSLKPQSVHKLRVSEDRLFKNQRIYLVPGGRYLLAHSLKTIMLYDRKQRFFIMPCPSPDGQEIRVLMSRSLRLYDPPKPTQTKISVIIIDLKDQGDEGPSTAKRSTILGSWISSFGQLPYTIAGDLVVFCDEPREGNSILVVWDYVQDKFAAWHIPTIEDSDDYLEVYTNRANVARVGLVYWKIPELRSRYHPESEIPIQDPLIALRVPLNWNNDNTL
ncbi:hypothetical protein CVT24_011792 [Panaeolus cyanescens]|uniref:F-box domain-containing protein n=1 Tax=Panaeolus cyanescens TaxID=181874 RepID=A0A409WDR9_9AGAR|nr:hypothetical protein CVT24_011792 [Panaeolus cyanescens]